MRRGLLTCVLLAGVACRGEGLPSAAVSADSPEPAPDEAEPAEASDPAPPARELWWEAGDGREAILARERRDHAGARRLLERYLAGSSGSVDDLGAASYLLALEQIEAGEDEAAIESLERARGAPGLGLLEPRMRLSLVQALLSTGQADRADELLRDFAPPEPLTGPAMLARADTHARRDAREPAIDGYRAYLEAYPGHRRAHEARAKLARLLEEGDGDAKREAREHWERLILAVPLSDYGEEAERRRRALDKTLGPARRGKAAKAFEREVDLARLDARLGRRQYEEAATAARKFLGQRGLPNADRCHAQYVEGTAIFKQRRRADARAAFDRAAVVCAKAGPESLDREVKSRYQGGRGWFAAGKHARAAIQFERLATDHARHSYADDAWLLAGEAWQEADRLDRARQAYEKVATAGGDMADEGWRRLAILELAQGQDGAALRVLDGAIQRGIGNPGTRSKAMYLRARTLARMGKATDARAGYLQAIAELPLDYPALQALSRLREQGDDAFTDGLARLQRAVERPLASTEPPASPGVERARLLARLGLGEEAQEELEVAGVTGWPAVALLNQAGQYRAAQRVTGNLGSGWRVEPPSGDGARKLWGLAHPLPFRSLVEPAERAHGVPPFLAYGIMQTESQFNPGATSWAGARGLIQLMPATAEDVARRAGKRLDPDELYDPATNLDIGVRYLGSLVSRFGAADGSAALAVPGYNAGAGAVDRWLDERGSWDLDLFIEAIPYDETRKYVQKVLGRWYIYRWLYAGGAAEERVPYIPLAIPTRVTRASG